MDKGYTTSYHVKKIIKSLPKKWRPMMTTLKVSKDMNKTTLGELIISLRSHEIELEEDESQKKIKYVALKSKGKPKKAKALLVEEKKYEERSTNFIRKYIQSSEATKEQMDNLSQPLG